jgi:hypothetical protein
MKTGPRAGPLLDVVMPREGGASSRHQRLLDRPLSRTMTEKLDQFLRLSTSAFALIP